MTVTQRISYPMNDRSMSGYLPTTGATSMPWRALCLSGPTWLRQVKS